MKVYVDCEEWMSLGIKRVVQALKQYAPKGVEVVSSQEEADLVVVHMVGNGQLQHWTTDNGKPFAAVQYCLRTTELPNTSHWIPTWERARCVWSYYDLMAKIVEDQNVTSGINFYHAPLGVNTRSFRPSMPTRKRFIIGTSGYIAETEGVLECHAVASRLEHLHFHLGPDLKLGPGVTYMTNIADDILADFWSQCTFVAGLRRIEGFELPIVEGLACGARPICFDSPHYRQWFDGLAEFVPEVEPAEVTEHLYSIMSKPVRTVTPAERSHVASTFNWETLVTGFWEATL